MKAARDAKALDLEMSGPWDEMPSGAARTRVWRGAGALYSREAVGQAMASGWAMGGFDKAPDAGGTVSGGELSRRLSSIRSGTVLIHATRPGRGYAKAVGEWLSDLEREGVPVSVPPEWVVLEPGS